MNISLPETMKSFVDDQVSARGYGSSSEYVRELIRREADREALRGLLLDGARSGVGETVTPAFFDRLRSRVRDHTST